MALNRAFVLEGALCTTFKELPTPELNEDDVLIEVKRTGICGSDVHFYTEGRLGDKVVTEPIVLGHESSGVIVHVGGKVDNGRIGERVAIEPWSVCRTCEHCKSGRYQMEPLAVAVHAVFSVGKLRAGKDVAVFGCGAIGLLCMAVSCALGASRIIAMDNNASRLEFAASYATAETFALPSDAPKGDTLRYSERMCSLLKHVPGLERGADLVIDATGAETCIQMGLMVTKAAGTFVQVGIGVANANIPYSLLCLRELTVKGSSRYGPGDYQLAIDITSSGKIDLKPLVTHRFNFEDSVAAFETTRTGMDHAGIHVLKAIISGPSV